MLRTKLENTSCYLRQTIFTIVVVAIIFAGCAITLYANLFHEYNAAVTSYETQIDTLTEQLQSTQMELEKEKATVNSLNVVYDELDKQYTELAESKEADFNVLKKYWYVLKYASRDSGLKTADLLHLEETCKEQNVNPHLVLSLMSVESDFQVGATSKTSTARGLGQIIRGTGKFTYTSLMGNSSYNHDQAFNAQTNMDMTASYLKYVLNLKNGNVENALVAYNGGELGYRYATLVKNQANKFEVDISDGTYQ